MQKRDTITLKTAVSTRMPLPLRADASRQGTAPPPASATPGQAAARSYFLQKRHCGYTTYGDASQAYVRSAADVPPRATERGVKSAGSTMTSTLPPATRFNATTTNKDATAGYCEAEDDAFFSRVRVVERNDDDARHSLDDPKTRSGAAKNLRCSAIQTKREHDSAFAPAPLKFKPVERVRPNATVSAHGTQPKRSASAAPALGASAGGLTLASTATGKATFNALGSTQSLDYPDPRGVAERATGILGAKQGKTLLASDRALVEGASSKDLFAGTGKAMEDVASGYMGHVPANPANVARVRGAGDPLRAHMKTVDTVTAPTSNSTTTLMRQKLAAARHAAEVERGRPMTPKTTSAFAATQAAFSDERRINRVECGRKNAVRGFFSRGEGEQDDLVADQFCTRYRPLEGMMRHGPPSSQSWVNDAELRRAPRL